MKRNVLLVFLALILIWLGLAYLTTSGPFERGDSYQDIPRYTADQVIDVAAALFPSLPRNERIADNLLLFEKPAWAAIYMGKGVWTVLKYGVAITTGKYFLLSTFNFNEVTGSLLRVDM